MQKWKTTAIFVGIGLAGIVAFLAFSFINGNENLAAKDIESSQPGQIQPIQGDNSPGKTGGQTVIPETKNLSPLGTLMDGYANSNTVEERLQFVKHTAGIEERMVKHYSHAKDGLRINYDEIAGIPAKSITVGEVVEVYLLTHGTNLYGQPVTDTKTYFVEKTENGYSILWEGSVGWMPMGLAALKATRPTEVTEIQFQCGLTHNYFTLDYRENDKLKATHYELNLTPEKSRSGMSIVGYVAKDSTAGKKIFDTLKDGYSHAMVLGIQYRDRQKEDCLWIRSVVSDRPYTYDENMRNKFVSPIEVSQPIATTTSVNFSISNLSAKWIINRDVLGSQVLVVPETRCRVTGTSTRPVTNLQLKFVYLKKKGKESEILYEDTKTVVYSSDRPLTIGLSKMVISKSGSGYKLNGSNTATVAYIIANSDVVAEVYYKTDDGFVKFKSIPVAKTLTN